MPQLADVPDYPVPSAAQEKRKRSFIIGAFGADYIYDEVSANGSESMSHGFIQSFGAVLRMET